MAAPIELDLSGFAGVSTHAQDLRRQNAGKRVTGMQSTRNRSENLDPSVASVDSLPGADDGLASKGSQRRQRNSMLRNNHIGLGFSQLGTSPRPARPAKPSRTRYATDQDYKEAFDTRWRADAKGRMALYLSRKPGYATIETNPDKLDMITTFHRERGAAGNSYKPDNLCNDVFLTGSPTALTMDVQKSPKNRSAPSNDSDGPFSRPLIGLHPSKIDHLDRTCNPRPEAPRAAIDNVFDTGGKGRMRVFREQSHIYSQGGFLIGDNRSPWKVDKAAPEEEPKAPLLKLAPHANRRALVCAPWTQASMASL